MPRSGKEREEPPILEEKDANDQNTLLSEATETKQKTPIEYVERTSIEAYRTDTLSNNGNQVLEHTENSPSTSNININSESHVTKEEIETNEASLDAIQSKHTNIVPSEYVIETEIPQEVLTPSAPLLEERPVFVEVAPKQECIDVIKIKTPCLPLEEAISLFGGEIIAEVKAMSEKEEAIVEAGPVCGPEHPLVDLLSTFRYVFCLQ